MTSAPSVWRPHIRHARQLLREEQRLTREALRRGEQSAQTFRAERGMQNSDKGIAAALEYAEGRLDVLKAQYAKASAVVHLKEMLHYAAIAARYACLDKQGQSNEESKGSGPSAENVLPAVRRREMELQRQTVRLKEKVRHLEREIHAVQVEVVSRRTAAVRRQVKTLEQQAPRDRSLLSPGERFDQAPPPTRRHFDGIDGGRKRVSDTLLPNTVFDALRGAQT